MHEYTIDVMFEDIDGTARVYHPNFLKYLERARTAMVTDYLKICGTNWHDCGYQRDWYCVVAKLDIKFVASIKANAKLSVRTSIEKLKKISMVFKQVICDYNDRDIVYAIASSKIAFINHEEEIIPMPEQWYHCFSRQNA